MDVFFSSSTAAWVDLGGGIRRKVVGSTPQLMSVLIEFEVGAVGTPHMHDTHDQIAFVLRGSFDAEVDGVKRVMRAGDAFIAAHRVVHGVVALEAGSTILDQFSPRRDDYL